MGFTVYHQGGTKDGEYRTYVRLLSRELLRRRVNFDAVPRVREEGTTNAWLYVWDTEAAASAFADELKRQTRDSGWTVRPVKTPPSLGPLRPLEIDVGRQGDGWVFALETFTRKALQMRFPGSCRARSLFIGTETEEEPLATTVQAPEQTRMVLLLLTGLRPGQLSSFESFRLVDPVEGKELVPPAAVEELTGE
jgi:hypothetical protein